MEIVENVEQECSENPANHYACWGCKHLRKVKDSPYIIGAFYGESEPAYVTYRCNAIYEDTVDDFGDRRRQLYSEPHEWLDGAVEMPTECDKFEAAWRKRFPLKEKKK